MIGDAVFINRAFKDHLAGVSLTIGICLTYILWVETIVRPLNIKPIGSVTSGLPYPFLNDMVLAQRAVFLWYNYCHGVDNIWSFLAV